MIIMWTYFQSKIGGSVPDSLLEQERTQNIGLEIEWCMTNPYFSM